MIFGLVFVLDVIETSRRASDIENAQMTTILSISLFRTPSIVEQTLPFAVLFGSMSAFLGLSRKLELIVARAAGAMGGLSILVNNAGVGDVLLFAEQDTAENWQRQYEINLRSVMFGCKHAMPHLRASGAASIVNISSIAGLAAAPGMGRVVLNIRPWGQVFVDGADRGVSPPLKSLPLRPGIYNIEVRNGDLEVYRQRVTVQDSKSAPVVSHEFNRCDKGSLMRFVRWPAGLIPVALVGCFAAAEPTKVHIFPNLYQLGDIKSELATHVVDEVVRLKPSGVLIMACRATRPEKIIQFERELQARHEVKLTLTLMDEGCPS
eukprot:gene44871-59889_t